MIEDKNNLIRLLIERRARLKTFYDIKGPEFLIDKEKELVASATYHLNELGFDVGKFIESDKYDEVAAKFRKLDDEADQRCDRCRSCIHIHTSYDEKGVSCDKNKFHKGLFFPDNCNEYKSYGISWETREQKMMEQCLNCKFLGSGEEYGDIDCLIKKDEFTIPCKFRKEKAS